VCDYFFIDCYYMMNVQGAMQQLHKRLCCLEARLGMQAEEEDEDEEDDVVIEEEAVVIGDGDLIYVNVMDMRELVPGDGRVEYLKRVEDIRDREYYTFHELDAVSVWLVNSMLILFLDRGWDREVGAAPGLRSEYITNFNDEFPSGTEWVVPRQGILIDKMYQYIGVPELEMILFQVPLERAPGTPPPGTNGEDNKVILHGCIKWMAADREWWMWIRPTDMGGGLPGIVVQRKRLN
jgi:hypothetical protein